MANDWREIGPGVWASKDAAPQVGTALGRERLWETFLSLNTPWGKSPPDESEDMTSVATNKELQQLCEKWKPRLGLEGWRIACEFKKSDDLPEGSTSGTCKLHQPTKAAIIAVAYPNTWDPQSPFLLHFPETFST